MTEREEIYKDGKTEIKWTIKIPETMDEYLSWDIPMEKENITTLWKKSHMIEMALINALIATGPKMDGITNPKVFKFLQKKLKDFLE